MMEAEIETRAALLATAGRAASTLQQSIAGKSPETPIETDVASLGGLASVIDALLAEAGRCAGADCMGRVIDGVKLWITRDRFEAIEARAVHLEERATRYEAKLRAIADAIAPARDEMDMFIDWQGTAQAMAAAARASLADDGA